MCMKREQENDDFDKLVYPFPIFDFIDLTMDELGEDDDTEITPRNDQWNYPYNLLPSNDEEEPVRGFVDLIEDVQVDYQHIGPNTNHNLLNEINQNANASVNINSNISDTNNTDQSSERREIELNIPQILLSMSRISHNLLPSNDEEEPVRGFVDLIEDVQVDYQHIGPNTNRNLLNEINQNANASVNINSNISDTNDTDQSSERREIELNIPQILLSMSRISNNLFDRASPFHD